MLKKAASNHEVVTLSCHAFGINFNYLLTLDSYKISTFMAAQF